MGYKIVYSKPMRQKESRMGLVLLVSLFFLTFSLCVRLTYPEIVNYLWEFMIPDQFSAEIEAFIDSISEAEQLDGVMDAVQVFCQEIIGGA